MKPFATVCVIDDDPIYTFTIRKMIDSAGIAEKTLFFPDGAQALDFFRAARDAPERLPDLVLLDLNMPVLNGWGFLEGFAELIPDLPKKIIIYIVSSSVDREEHQRAAAIPVVAGMLVKPISRDRLRQITDDAGGN